jgi:hypothetical protein
MLLNITNGEVICPFDNEDMVEVTELPLKYVDEYDTRYEVPLERQTFLQQGIIRRFENGQFSSIEPNQRRQNC